MAKGGKRAGAGRPAKPDSNQHNISLPEEVWTWLKSQGKPSAVIEDLARKQMMIEESEAAITANELDRPGGYYDRGAR